MSTSNHGGELDAGLLSLLARLTRKGARIKHIDGRGVIAYPGDRPVRSGSLASERRSDPAVTAAAVERGWLDDDGSGALRLTEAGALALRSGAARSLGAAMTTAPTMSEPATRQAGPTRRGGARKIALALNPIQAAASERFALDFTRGQMQPRVTADWDRAALGFAPEHRRGAGDADRLGEGASAAQERTRRALDDAGPEFANLLIDLCCLDLGLEACERQRGWPPRSARLVLGLALDRLARHYGLVSTAPRRGRSRHWGDGSHRPTGSSSVAST